MRYAVRRMRGLSRAAADDLIMQVGNDLAQTGPLEMSHRPVGRVPDPVNGLAGRPAASM